MPDVPAKFSVGDEVFFRGSGEDGKIVAIKVIYDVVISSNWIVPNQLEGGIMSKEEAVALKLKKV
jgi:hypothetical protein